MKRQPRDPYRDNLVNRRSDTNLRDPMVVESQLLKMIFFFAFSNGQLFFFVYHNTIWLDVWKLFRRCFFLLFFYIYIYTDKRKKSFSLVFAFHVGNSLIYLIFCNCYNEKYNICYCFFDIPFMLLNFFLIDNFIGIYQIFLCVLSMFTVYDFLFFFWFQWFFFDENKDKLCTLKVMILLFLFCQNLILPKHKFVTSEILFFC